MGENGDQASDQTETIAERLQVFFKQQSSFVSINRANAFDLGLNLSEETVTELFVYQLAGTFPNTVYVRAFSKREEHKNGADWEWCFASTWHSQYLRVRVQAKALYNPSERYEALKFTDREKEAQIATFTQRCKEADLFGIYSFYNYKSALCPESWGISVADALSVRAKADTNYAVLCTVSEPLQEILKGAGEASSQSLSSLVHANLQRLRRLGDNELESMPGLNSTKPDYMHSLIFGEDLGSTTPHDPQGIGFRRAGAFPEDTPVEVRPAWEANMIQANPHLAGVVLFVTRQRDGSS